MKSVKLSDTARHPYERLCGIGDEMQHIKNDNTALKKDNTAGQKGTLAGTGATRRGKGATHHSAVLRRPRMNTVVSTRSIIKVFLFNFNAAYKCYNLPIFISIMAAYNL